MNYNVTDAGNLIDYYGELKTVKIPDQVNGVKVTNFDSFMRAIISYIKIYYANKIFKRDIFKID